MVVTVSAGGPSSSAGPSQEIQPVTASADGTDAADDTQPRSGCSTTAQPDSEIPEADNASRGYTVPVESASYQLWRAELALEQALEHLGVAKRREEKQKAV